MYGDALLLIIIINKFLIRFTTNFCFYKTILKQMLNFKAFFITKTNHKSIAWAYTDKLESFLKQLLKQIFDSWMSVEQCI